MFVWGFGFLLETLYAMEATHCRPSSCTNFNTGLGHIRNQFFEGVFFIRYFFKSEMGSRKSHSFAEVGKWFPKAEYSDTNPGKV